MTTATSLPADIKKRGRPLKLIIVTPLLRVDAHAIALNSSLATLRQGGLEFTHIVIHSPLAIDPQAAFPEAIILKEDPSEKGVFPAVSQGFDFAINQCGATHLAFINSDDLLYPEYAGFWHQTQETNPAIIIARTKWISEEKEVFGLIPWWPFKNLCAELFEIGVQPFTQQSVIIRSDLWTSIGGFDSKYKYIADSVLWWAIARQSTIIKFHHSPVSGYCLRPGQLSGDTQKVRQEVVRWQEQHSRNALSLLIRRVAVILFRFYNFKIYINRLIRRQVLFSGKAMQQSTWRAQG